MLKFIFAVIVLILHFEDNYKFSYFKQGYIGVEFFFLVSGFLMAKQAERVRHRVTTLGEAANETWKFTVKKIGHFFPYYVTVMFLWLMLRYVIIRHVNLITAMKYILRSLPTISLTFMGLCHDYTGLYVGNTWYLSAMIIAMFMLYPLLLRQYDFFSKNVFPFISIFILQYIYKKINSICATFEWNGYIYLGVLRAIAEIAIGASLCALSGVMTTKFKWLFNSDKGAAKLFFTALKAGCYGIVFLYAYGIGFGGAFSIHAFLYCAIGVLLSFSGAGYMIPDTKVTRYLGKLSLPLFVYHGLFRWVCRDITGTVAPAGKTIVLMIVGSFVLSVILMYVTDFITKWIKNGAAAIKSYLMA